MLPSSVLVRSIQLMPQPGLDHSNNQDRALYIEGILPKGPYRPCVSMAGGALLAGYPQYEVYRCPIFDTLKASQNGCPFADDIVRCIFLNKNISILNKISLKYVPSGLIGNMAALVQIKAWLRTGDKPLCEPMLLCFTDIYICVCHLASTSWWLEVNWIQDKAPGY